MKVESQSSTSQVDYLKQLNTDSEAHVLMKLLNKCVEDISSEAVDTKLKAETEKSSSKESSSLAGAPKSASKKKSHDQIFLEAYMTSLQIDNQLKVLSQDSIKMLLMRANQDAQHLDKLTKEIKELQGKLSESMSVQEIQEIISKINDLIGLYSLAIIQYTDVEKSYQDCQSRVQDLSQKITALQNKYDNIKDKYSKEAKDAKAELEAAISKRIETQKEMKNAEMLMEKAEASMKDAISQLAMLSSQYPDFAQKIDALKTIMESKGSIEEAAITLLQDLKETEAATQEIVDQISYKQADRQSILDTLTEKAELIKGIVADISQVDVENLDKKEAELLLNNILDRYFNQVEVKEQKENDKNLKVDTELEDKIELDKKLEFQFEIRG